MEQYLIKILIILGTYFKLILTSWPAIVLILFILVLFRHRGAVDGLIRRIIKITREGLYFEGPSGSEPVVPPTVSKSQDVPAKPESYTSKHGVARVFYQIAHVLPNSVQFDFAKEHKAWFWIFNYDPQKYLAYVKIKFIADGIEKESTSDYYGGIKAWKLNAYSGIQAPGLDFPEEIKNAVKQDKIIKIEIKCKVHDEFNEFIEEKLPQTYVYNSKDNSWFLEP